VWMERLLMVVTTASVVAGVWQLLATTQQDIFDLDMLAAMQSGPTGCRRAWGASWRKWAAARVLAGPHHASHMSAGDLQA